MVESDSFDPEIASSNPDRGINFFVSPFHFSATCGRQWISHFWGLEMVHHDHISVLPLFFSQYRCHLIDTRLKRKLPNHDHCFIVEAKAS